MNNSILILFFSALVLSSCTSIHDENSTTPKQEENNIASTQQEENELQSESLENDVSLDIESVVIPTVKELNEKIADVKESCSACRCDGNDDMDMAEMTHCEYLDYLEHKKQLYVVYEKILKEYKYETSFIEALKDSQKAWISFLDFEMSLYFPEKGNYGSIENFCWVTSLTDLTIKRMNDLNLWLEGIDQGESCYPSVKRK